MNFTIFITPLLKFVQYQKMSIYISSNKILKTISVYVCEKNGHKELFSVKNYNLSNNILCYPELQDKLVEETNFGCEIRYKLTFNYWTIIVSCSLHDTKQCASIDLLAMVEGSDDLYTGNITLNKYGISKFSGNIEHAIVKEENWINYTSFFN